MISRTNTTKILILLISIGMWCINFFYVHQNKPISFRIAKGFGLNLRVWPLFLYITMCRNLLQGKVEKHVVYHKFIGNVVTICTLGHTIAHAFYSRVNDITHVSGYILTSMFLLMAITYYLRNYGYHVFKYTHYLYYIILPILIIHVPRYWEWFALALILLIIESTINVMNLQYSTIRNYEKKNGHMFISIPKIIDSKPGSYYYLCVPSISLEWHPFSTCSSTHINHLTFLIECKGDWTRKFYDQIDKEYGKEIMVVGPFKTSSSNVLSYNVNNKKIVCSGLGITPFLSVIKTEIDEYNSNQNYRNDYHNIFQKSIEQQRAYSLIDVEENLVTFKSRKLDVHWSFRDLSKVDNFFKFVVHNIKNSKNINLHLYITGNMSKDEKEEFLDEYSSYVKSIKFGRMHIKDFLSEDEIGDESKIEDLEIFFCGSHSIREPIKDYCKENKIRFYSEVF